MIENVLILFQEYTHISGNRARRGISARSFTFLGNINDKSNPFVFTDLNKFTEEHETDIMFVLIILAHNLTGSKHHQLGLYFKYDQLALCKHTHNHKTPIMPLNHVPV